MKKRAFVLTLVMAIFMVGCGNEGTKELNESQTTENTETNETETDETETDETEINEAETNETETDDLDNYMTSIKEQADNIKSSLSEEELTQSEMNIKSQELYELWDEALNNLWGKLEKKLSEDDFSKLQDEQRTWIAEKEKSVEEVGKDVEGGSLYSMVVNMEAARITEERVYELYELFE